MTRVGFKACIGWPAEPPCPAYGPMHGCGLPEGHWGGHQCACGLVRDRAEDLRLGSYPPDVDLKHRRQP